MDLKLLPCLFCSLPRYNPERREETVSKSLSEWLNEGEHLYNQALKEYQAIEAQLDELEQRLIAKKAEVNQIAQVIGKPPVEGNRRLSAQLVEDHGPASIPHSQATIARALTGRALGR
jgi:DNA primase